MFSIFIIIVRVTVAEAQSLCFKLQREPKFIAYNYQIHNSPLEITC